MNPLRQTHRRNGRVALVLVAALAPALAMPRAYAQAASPNVVIAENLFREGQALLEQAKTDDSKTHLACEKFAESEQLRPALGTLLNLAVCHEKEKKTASAWAEYTEVAGQASRAGQGDRAQFASQHAAALESQLCRVRLEMAAVPTGVEVKIDGQPLGAAVLGTDIPLDPGAHSVVVSAPSKQAWTHDFTLTPGQPTDHETVPPLLDEVVVAPVTAVQATSRGPLGYVVGGVGIAALAVGGVLIGRSAAYGSQSDDESAKAKTFSAGNPNEQSFSNAATSDHNAGKTNLIIGAAAGGAGLIGVGVGLYFLLAAPAKETSPKAGVLRFMPNLGRGRVGANVGFSF
jgi:hypothetical protein